MTTPRARILRSLRLPLGLAATLLLSAACGGPLEGESVDTWDDGYADDAEALVAATAATASPVAIPTTVAGSTGTTVAPVVIPGSSIVVVGLVEGDSSPDPIPARVVDFRQVILVGPGQSQPAQGDCPSESKDGARNGHERDGCRGRSAGTSTANPR